MQEQTEMLRNDVDERVGLLTDQVETIREDDLKELRENDLEMRNQNEVLKQNVLTMSKEIEQIEIKMRQENL